MKDTVTQFLARAQKHRARKKRTAALLLSLSLVVALGVTWSLHSTGESLTDDAFCGLAEHTHSEDCELRTLTCGLEETAGHTHTDECYTDQSVLTCGEDEVLGHTHTDECYTDQQTAVCGLEETAGHTHSDACYTDQQTAVCGLEETAGHTHSDACYTEQETLACGQEESVGHTHSDSCYETYTSLTCGAEEHTHSDACYDADGNLACGLDEHAHSDACYTSETVLTCGQDEYEGHTHTADCYITETVLTCGQDECEAHTHTADCYVTESVLTCGQDECEAHTHTDECYITETVLTCGEEECDPGHVHTDECYTTETVLSCGEEECEPHTHTDDCYTIEYTCGLDEHTHTLACYSNPDADLETESDWTAAFSGLTLTGDAGTDVAAIARTQLGYTESSANYQVVNGVAKGYTRYGAWYGIPYGDWCAMFASFCIHYAGVDYPTAAACDTWIRTLSAYGYYAAAGSATPSVGDLVFFDWTGDGTADHVGIVSALTADGSVLVQTAETEETTEAAAEAEETAEAEDTTEETAETDDTAEETAEAEDTAGDIAEASDSDANADGVAAAEVADDTAAEAEDTAAVEDATPTDAEAAAEVEDDAEEEAEEETPDGILVIEGNYSNAVKENAYSLSNSAILGYGLMPRAAADDADTDDTDIYAARVAELLAASDEDFIGLWTAYYLEASDADAAALEEYIESLADTDPDTYDALISRVDTLINGAVEEADLTEKNASDRKTGAAAVNYYAFVNGARKLVKSVSGETAYYFGEDSRYYLSADTLVAVYADFGVTLDMLTKNDKRYFPHTNAGGDTIWGDTSWAYVTEDDETKTYYSPITNSGAAVDVYYLPGAEITSYDSWSNYTTKDTFYTITVEDAGSKIYTTNKLPTSNYVLHGQSGTVSVTVKNADGVTWRLLDSSGNDADSSAYTKTDNPPDGTTTYSVTYTAASEGYTLTTLAANEIAVIYNLNLPQTPADNEYGSPQIGGSTTAYEDVTAAGMYTLLSPSLTSYFYNYETNDYGKATFLGWTTDSSITASTFDTSKDTCYEAGAEITISSSITLYGVWSTVATKSNSGLVGFYVALSNKSEGETKWSWSTDPEAFTSAVYADDCGITGTTKTDLWYYDGEGKNSITLGDDGSGNTTVFGGTTGENLEQTDKLIRESLTAGIYKYNSSTGGYDECKLTFPDDETVLRAVRAKVKNGKTITFPTVDEEGKTKDVTVSVDELTAENYTVKWYVFKYTTGWHIDGYLVAKTGELTVTKTFAGNEDAMKEMESGYTITVSAKSSTSGTAAVYTEDRTLVTTAQATDSDTNKAIGWTSHNEETHTYTWTVPVDQYYLYTVRENNYIDETKDTEGKSLYTTTAQYRVLNDIISAENGTDGLKDYNVKNWTVYNSSTGVTVTGNGKSADTTVSFLNTYVSPGTLVIQKVDAETGDLMPNVSFNIAKTENGSFVVYRNGTTSSYSYEQSGGYTTATNTVVTDYSGQAYIYLNAGTYTLTEQELEGYDSPGEITVVLSASAAVEGHVGIESVTVQAAKNRTYAEKNTEVTSGVTMTVNNYTSKYIDLTVVKEWSDDENKSVTMQLYRNGTSMGSSYKVTLDGTETTAWQYTWEDLPLYVNGALATYTIKEINIGEFYYYDSSTDADGYKYYDVTISVPVYTMGGVSSPQADADAAAITVTNKRTTTDVYITKTDENGKSLSGAYFKLYYISGTDENTAVTDTTKVPMNVTLDDTSTGLEDTNTYPLTATKSSDTDGTVSFGYKLSNGCYYLVESQAPDGYVLSGKLYLLQVAGSDVTLYERTGTEDAYTWTQLANNTISNTPREYTATLRLTKVAAGDTTGLAGAKFTLTNDEGKYYSAETADTNGDDAITADEVKWSDTEQTFTTPDTGQLTFTLPEGIYTLKETSPPSGYYILNANYTVKVNAKGQIYSVTKTNGSALTAGSTTATYDGEGVLTGYTQAYTIENYAGYTLPKTGGAGTTLYTLGGLAVMTGAFLVGCGLRRRRERRAD